MPYRRLPNTDLSRISSLEAATKMEGFREHGDLVLSYRTTQDALQFLIKFKKAHSKYINCHELHLKSSKTYRGEVNTARMYVSHFVQVLYFAVQRGELKKEILPDYGIDPDNFIMPDLSLEPAIVEWGERIIKAEEDRTRKGGIPIYNPTIAKVKVHWTIFKDHYIEHDQLRQNSAKALDEVTQMRPQADDIILDIWNQVEAFYNGLPQETKIEKCKKFGLIYYYRSIEKKRKLAAEQQNFIDF
ncbi:MAG: hypothetical protein Q4B58_03880 [Bacteroidales bacterium]|nr:hypothetical protein [Bacteroidales bacterium]